MATFGVYLVLFLTACPLNLILTWTILRNQQIRTIANVLISSLAISDFLLGVFVVPSELLHVTFREYTPKGYICVIHQCVQIFVPLVSVAHLLVISVDRYIKIVHPLKYTRLITKRRLCVLLVSVWLLPLLVSSLPVLGWNNYGEVNGTVYTTVQKNITECDEFETLPCPFQGIMFTFVFLTILVMIILYVKISILASIQLKRIAEVTIARNSRGNFVAMEFKMVGVLALTVGFFVLSWLPLAAVTSHQCLSGQHMGVEWWSAAFIVAYLNSSLNPLIYGIGNRDIRETFLKSLPCKCRKIAALRPNTYPLALKRLSIIARNNEIVAVTTPTQNVPVSYWNSAGPQEVT